MYNNNFYDDFNEDNLDINKMIEIHYELTKIFENKDINILGIELPVENDYGFIEYKRNLNTYINKLSKLKTQIYWRCSEGLNYNSQSSCYYIIGIEDNGEVKDNKIDYENNINIINECIKSSDIKYFYKKIFYQNKELLLVKFFKEEILNNTDLRIILLGPSESDKTNFFIRLHNCKFYETDTQINKMNNKISKSNIYDIHNDENKLKKTLILHHQYFNVKYKKDMNIIDFNNYDELNENLIITDEDGLNIHIIDTSGNSIISNIKYLISYNVDIIIYFNHINSLYDNILQKINDKYNNVIKITDTTYIQDLNTKKLLHQALLKYNTRIKILDNIEDILLINETRLIQSHQETKFNKYIFYSYNLMNMNIYDYISEIHIRNIQYKYNYKSSIYSNNSISIETDKPIHKPILGKTKQLNFIDLDLNLIDNEENENILTYYILILNQIYIINSKNIPPIIIFDKIIIVPEKYKKLPIFVIWSKNNTYFLKIFEI
jgi:hypothetical protein